MELNKDICCCFTGHRPEKIKSSETEIRSALKVEINKAIQDGYTTFITGMAPGVDIWAANEVIAVRESNPGIKLICAIPFEGVEKSRSAEQQTEFATILQQADGAQYICHRRAKWCFIARDRWMVDNSSRVIAVFNGTSGGTEKTINYAREKHRDVILIADGNT